MAWGITNKWTNQKFSEKVRERVEPLSKTSTLITPRDWKQHRDQEKPSPSSEDIVSCYQEGPSWADFLSPTHYRDGYLYYNMSTLCE